MVEHGGKAYCEDGKMRNGKMDIPSCLRRGSDAMEWKARHKLCSGWGQEKTAGWLLG